MINLEKVDNFLNETRVFFLSTTDGDQPIARPFNVHCVVNGKLCFMTGDKKNVYKQLMANPKVRITALNQKTEWLRVIGTAFSCEDQSVSSFSNSRFVCEWNAHLILLICL